MRWVSTGLAIGLGVLACARAAAVGQETGSIVGWGGQVLVPESALANLVALSAGYGHSLALKGDGSIVAWGWNHRGQCTVPLPNSGFVAIAAGGYHSLGLKIDGSIAGTSSARRFAGDAAYPARR